jgi:16S rRNA processing protein RimM
MGVDAGQRVGLGRIVGLYGVKGWVKVESWTRPPQNILNYPEWLLGRDGQWHRARVIGGRRHGHGLVAQLAGGNGVVWDNRDGAAGLVGSEIAVLRGQLPPLAPKEFYWADLVGLEVENLAGERLGRVQELFETPAHDVLVVAGVRRRLIPCVLGPVVKSVDLDAGLVRVDWADPVE